MLSTGLRFRVGIHPRRPRDKVSSRMKIGNLQNTCQHKCVSALGKCHAHQTPVTGETLYSVQDSVYDYLSGLQTSVGGLNSMRSNGRVLYTSKSASASGTMNSALREYVISKITDEVSSTSEMKANKK